MMEPVRRITGKAVPLRRSDVDTDQIIPAHWLKRVERTGFGQGLFSSWREDPSFVLLQPRHAGATILVTGPNFGTGSSREHAVWALLDYGFRAVVSARFADIFRSNCTKAGLVPAQLAAATVERLLGAIEADPDLEVTVDLRRRLVAAPAAGIEASFPIDDFTRHRLLEGLDDIALTLENDALIRDHEQRRPPWLPSMAP